MDGWIGGCERVHCDGVGGREQTYDEALKLEMFVMVSRVDLVFFPLEFRKEPGCWVSRRPFAVVFVSHLGTLPAANKRTNLQPYRRRP